MQMIAGFFGLGRLCCTARVWSSFLPLLQEVSSICKTRNQLVVSLLVLAVMIALFLVGEHYR